MKMNKIYLFMLKNYSEKQTHFFMYLAYSALKLYNKQKTKIFRLQKRTLSIIYHAEYENSVGQFRQIKCFHSLEKYVDGSVSAMYR